MRNYMLTDCQGREYPYQATDMRMALGVHWQLIGTEIQKAEETTEEPQ